MPWPPFVAFLVECLEYFSRRGQTGQKSLGQPGKTDKMKSENFKVSISRVLEGMGTWVFHLRIDVVV